MSKTEKNEESHVSVDSVKHQLLSYEHQIKEYLDKLEATVDTYKFSVEKHGEDLTLDMALKATIHVKSTRK
jgi:hypothetical protein